MEEVEKGDSFCEIFPWTRGVSLGITGTCDSASVNVENWMKREGYVCQYSSITVPMVLRAVDKCMICKQTYLGGWRETVPNRIDEVDATPGGERCCIVFNIVHRLCSTGWGKERLTRRGVLEVAPNTTTGRE